MANIKYQVGCSACIAAKVENPPVIEWNATDGFHCAQGHKFLTIEDAQGFPKAEEATRSDVVKDLDTIDEIVKEGEATVPPSADSHVEESPVAAAVEQLQDGPVSLAQAANLMERVESNGDVIIQVSLRADYVGHLREEALTQQITLQEHVQRYLNSAIENSWL